MTEITRKRGDTYPIALTVTKNGSPVNITGGEFILTADPSREPTGDENNIFQLPGTITDAENGRVDFPFTEMQADHVGEFFYDVQMTLNGVKSTLVIDKLTLKQDITKT